MTRLDPTELIILLAGAALIGFLTWFFFGPRKSVAARRDSAHSAQEIEVVVDGGYDPSTIEVEAGVPVRLVFDRRDPSSCAEEVVLGDFGIRKLLPVGKKTAIEFTPKEPGRFAFTCGMGMLRGTLVVQ